MDAVKEMKEWLIDKFQHSAGHDRTDQKASKVALPLTPQNIPQFVIPGSNDSSRRASDCSGENEITCVGKRNSYGGRGSSPPDSPSHGLTASDSVPCMRGLKGNDRSNSAPVTPKREYRNLTGVSGDLESHGGGSNDDPLSFAAMSLSHFRGQTPYGFTTLTEMPHTRRKESLFHLGGGSLLKKNSLKQFSHRESLSRYNDHSAPDITLLSTPGTLNTKQNVSTSMPSVIITSFTSGSQTPSPDMATEASPNFKLTPGFQGLNQIPLPSRHNRFYNRRRSSLLCQDISANNSESDTSSATTGSCCSTPSHHSLDMGKDITNNNNIDNIASTEVTKTTVKRHSTPHIPTSETLSVDAQTKQRSSSCHTLTKGKLINTNKLFAPYGELKFSFQYLAASRHLKVVLIRAENLGGQGKQDKNINPFAKMYLMPGKIQKQTSSVYKRTKNPVFDNEFLFQNISLEELQNLTLKIKIFSKGSNLKLPEFLGEVTINLDGYDVMVDNRLWKDLESRKDREELGFIGVGLKFDPDEATIVIMIEQAKLLPLHPITGTPDPYVRVEISQPNRSVSKKQTSTKKKTSNPVFQETLTFPISPKNEDMSSTSVIITVFDHDRIRSDEVIGHVVLGCMATEVCQHNHWQEVMDNPKTMVSKWHYLVDYAD